MRRNPVGLIICAAVLAAPGVGRSQGSLEACATIDDDAQRLGCYDRLAGRAVQSSPSLGPSSQSAAPGVPAAAAVGGGVAARPAVVADPVADFGLSDLAIKQRAPDEWVGSISGRVTTVSILGNDRYVITLENGQVWEQTERNPRAILSPGDSVTIKRAALGSFKLNGPRSVYWRVQRVK